MPSVSHAAVAIGVLTVLTGLLFKIGGVPTHFWVPDVTEGATAPVAAFVTTVPRSVDSPPPTASSSKHCLR